ncbi:hypothetical protein TorRG33x02_295650 [Trema orientale]|uniref:Uncharacterized protein n=1 Tax=Trema orientale TaxID=63057 RepID=A0A2P5C732_TREOI|nr:hypothetical protein TorRG33x02_295650 [Trema orientale]
MDKSIPRSLDKAIQFQSQGKKVLLRHPSPQESLLEYLRARHRALGPNWDALPREEKARGADSVKRNKRTKKPFRLAQDCEGILKILSDDLRLRNHKGNLKISHQPEAIETNLVLDLAQGRECNIQLCVGPRLLRQEVETSSLTLEKNYCLKEAPPLWQLHHSVVALRSHGLLKKGPVNSGLGESGYDFEAIINKASEVQIWELL